MDKICIACGMPMKNREDYAAGDINKSYCKFCCRSDGSMQSYDEKMDSMSNFISRTKKINYEAARDLARKVMADLPAWKDH